MSNKTVIGYILRPYFTTKDGRKVFASQYGKKVFRIPLYDKTEKVDKK
jgi:hypothetical protein